MKRKLNRTKDGNRTLYYRPLPRPRSDGVTEVLVGYRRDGKDHWF